MGRPSRLGAMPARGRQSEQLAAWQLAKSPQVLYEERLMEVPQAHVSEFTQQTLYPQYQDAARQGLKIVETEVVQKTVRRPQTPIQETAVEAS